MTDFSLYFAKQEYYTLIRNLGGAWNDSKERPLVCLLNIDSSSIFWGIPVGNWSHRNRDAQRRILSYTNLHKRDIRSCYYHVGNTDIKSIFFISDVVPITEQYKKNIERYGTINFLE